MSKKKISWRLHFVELIVVIIGITIAFTLEGISDKNKEQQLEEAYLASLKSDIQRDIDEIRLVIDSSLVIRQILNETFQYAYSGQKVEVFKRHHITSTYTPPYFYTKNGTYLSLVNSGNLNVLKNFEIKSDLADLYEVSYGEIVRLDSFLKKLVDDMIYPYMIKNIEFSGFRDGIESADPLRNNEVTNLLGSYGNFIRIRNETYEKTITECQAILTKLNQELDIETDEEK